MTATTIPKEIFKAYDIRGIVSTALTPQAVELIGRAIAAEALAHNRRTVVIGRDGRLSGPALSAALAAGLQRGGVDVIDIGLVPTPVLYFAAHQLQTYSGVMVTGSHNPPEYNGLKILIDGEFLAGPTIQMLRERIVAQNFSEGAGSKREQPMIETYMKRITGDVKLARPLKIVVDCGNGVAGAVAPQLYRQFGCDITELYCEVDGNFPNHHPDPSVPANLRELIESVAARKADLGLAFDGDGDRLGVVTSSGKIIYPDRFMMLFAADVLSRNPGAEIIFDVKSTRHLAPWIKSHGGRPLMWKTGHSFIKHKMKETGALLAGEMSGHVFFKERWYGFDDAVYAGARLMEYLSKQSDINAVLNALPDSMNTPELQVPFSEGENYTFIDKLRDSAKFEGARELITIDGLRVEYEDGFGLARASNTTPVVVLRFEGNTQAALNRIQNDFRRAMLNVQADVKLPF